MKVDNDGNFLADVKKSPLDDANIIKLNVLPENKQEKLDIGFGKVNNDLLIPPKFLLGDINEDGNLSILDVTLLQMICTNSLDAKESQKLAADYNADGQIDVNDATALQIYISKNSLVVFSFYTIFPKRHLQVMRVSFLFRFYIGVKELK